MNRNTFLDELKKANAINKRVFSIFINAYDISRSVAPHNEKSNIILGGYDLKYAME